MLRQFEIILTALCMALITTLLIIIMVRIRNVFIKQKARVSIWDREVGILTRVSKLTMATALLLLTPGLIYYIFVFAVPSAVIRTYAKTLFIIIFSAWALLEIFLCFSISERLLKGSKPRRLSYFSAVVACIALAAYLFPLIPRSLIYPPASECVTLELPVRGTWIAGQAGASDITNGHLTKPYAIDILKLGPDGRMFTGDESKVADFYSYDEPVYAPADGCITETVDGVESDLLGTLDEKNPGGNYVIIDIGNGKYVVFAHLKKGTIAVEEGQFVATGALLATIGNSGYSTHPHLHMHVQNKPEAEAEGVATYPFRFEAMRRKRLLFWVNVSDGYLLRNDWFSDLS
jgi:hypothetical protein